ncbi:NAD(P)-binding protein [Nonomuraea sp. NPDC048826]|uniref:NAD(P)-binding protein n=1 Tax=Nonomuraea sp. NPDC048826 TaxID=3364347 RepID=UPI0037154D56
MRSGITRRDFLDGIALTGGALALGGLFGGGTAAAATGPGNSGKPKAYPPALTGLRGSHVGSFEIAHALRDGTFWDKAGKPSDTGETFDLVVVGAGISGLSAAHFYLRDVNRNARILVIDPHDDFGGHAKRNEFTVKGKTLIGYGGSQSIDTPSSYPPEAKQLLTDVGIDIQKFYTYYDRTFYANHGAGGRAVHFDAEQWGRTHVSLVPPGSKLEVTLKDAPLDDASKQKLIEVYEGNIDYLPGLSAEEKLDRLRRLTYGQFLRDHAGVSGAAYDYMLKSTMGGTGMTIDYFGALDAAASGYPGTGGLGLDYSGEPWPGLIKTYTRMWGATDPYIFHFPDGNASIARALVRRLVPGALPGNSMEDLVTSTCNYKLLDNPGNRVKIRLNSTAVRVAHTAGRRAVEIQYVQDGKLKRVQAGGVVLACWNSMIPHIVPEMPDEQKAAGHEAVKYPIVYANVALRNWKPWAELGINSIRFANGLWSSAALDFPVSMGRHYKFSANPNEPIVAHFSTGFTPSGLANPQAAAKAGRAALARMSFEDLERSMRAALADVLTPAGFDPAKDIAGITVNRWAHGYARYYILPWDADIWPHGPTPADKIGTPLGRITVSTTDQANHGFVDGAIESAYRAVTYLKEVR